MRYKRKRHRLFCYANTAKYGEDYYCVDCVCDNTADYEMQYENASNTLVNNQVQECEFERNAGGDRVAMEVNKRVENKGWICNITDVPTETNKEARIFQCSNWILQHIIFKDQSLYKPNEPYGVMVSLLKRYSVTGKNSLMMFLMFFKLCLKNDARQ